MTLEKLGRILDRAIQRMERRGLHRVAEQLRDMARRGEYTALRQWAMSGFLGAEMRAWALHATWLDLPTLPPAAVQGELVERAIAFANDVVARVSAVYGAGEPPVSPRVYVRLVADVATRRGWSEGAEVAAEKGGARWKTWVRVYPVREPRDWHVALEGQTIPETAKYTLPGGPNAGQRVDAPHDWDSVPDPREWINCGHAVIYTPHATWGDVMKRNHGR